jgi:NADPH:quinone reductase-like Zn-dependent oxidoreductase
MVPKWLLPRIPGGGKHPGIRFVKNIMDDLAQLGQWVREGKLRVIVDSVFDFEDATTAIEKLANAKSKRKGCH